MRPSGAKANAVMSSSMVVVGLSSDCARAGGENAKRKMPQTHARIGASAAHREKKRRPASGEWQANTGRDVIPSAARNLLFGSMAGNSGFLARKPLSEGPAGESADSTLRLAAARQPFFKFNRRN